MRTKEERAREFKKIAAQQRGATPYNNTRHLTVKGAQDGITLSTFLERLSGWKTIEQQNRGLEDGRLDVDGRRRALNTRLRAGNIVRAVFCNVTEPIVATNLAVIYEDQHLLGVIKPAPLPVHPSGRYNRHSLTEIAKLAWPDITLKPVHRLDASTGGLLIFGKDAKTANRLSQAFASQRVQKRYAARVRGVPERKEFTSNVPIHRRPGHAGQRSADSGGQAARTDFECIETLADQTTTIWCLPRTGRTNQIRIHLQSAGHPILGDRVYGMGLQSGEGFAEQNERLYLFACGLTLSHPRTGELLNWAIDPPAWFFTLSPSD